MSSHRRRSTSRDTLAGRTNSEIGTELFITPRTVEWHLKKVFTKLGIRSRKGLPDALPARAGVRRAVRQEIAKRAQHPDYG
jgi:DNA-binding NarL/FixJ family response regulator